MGSTGGVGNITKTRWQFYQCLVILSKVNGERYRQESAGIYFYRTPGRAITLARHEPLPFFRREVPANARTGFRLEIGRPDLPAARFQPGDDRRDACAVLARVGNEDIAVEMRVSSTVH